MPEPPTHQEADTLKKVFTAMIPLDHRDRLKLWVQVGVVFGFTVDATEPKNPMRFGDAGDGTAS